jgi:hypothetical protein
MEEIMYSVEQRTTGVSLGVYAKYTEAYARYYGLSLSDKSSVFGPDGQIVSSDYTIEAWTKNSALQDALRGVCCDILAEARGTGSKA